ncbi:hypothetical protein [Nonomuraea jabiensis]|uniref:hypothetical protein n=1 Tax=Nonomuraea jabiensis TaxID=882448 RepID=UPI003D7080CB
MTTITAEKVAKHLADWGDYEWIDSENKVRTSCDGNVISFETWKGEYPFHAIVQAGKYGEPLTEEPKVYGAVVLDREGDVWQLRSRSRWYCAIDGDDFSYWSWDQLVELGPLTLLHPGFDDDDDQEV